VCDCYLQAPELLAQFDTHTVCIDEMTGIQALERIAPKKRCDPGGTAAFMRATARNSTRERQLEGSKNSADR